MELNEELNKELTDEQVEETAGGFANMPNPFANQPHVTRNEQIYDGTGHANGETWRSGTCMMYKVKKGDTLYNIALAHNLTLKQVQLLNPQIKDSHWIHPGDVLMLRNDLIG